MSLWNTSSSSGAADRPASAANASARRRSDTARGPRNRLSDTLYGERWIPAAGTALPDPAAVPVPRVLWIEATEAAARLASWWDGDWWPRALAAWNAAPLRVVLLPTPGAILHPAVLDRVHQARRTARAWRFAARTAGEGLASTSAVDRLLRAPYHEIEFALHDAALAAGGRGHDALRAEQTLAVMKQLIELRDARGQTSPAVVWLWDARAGANDDRVAAARAMARQIHVDRFVVPEPLP